MRGSYSPYRRAKEIYQEWLDSRLDELTDRELEEDVPDVISDVRVEGEFLILIYIHYSLRVPIFDEGGGPSSQLYEILGDRVYELEGISELVNAIKEG